MRNPELQEIREIRHYHVCCGLGGGAKGFNAGSARVGNMTAKMRCIGGIDNDPAAIRDFEKLTGVKGTVLDLFSREQYKAFHGKEPPAEWREATPEDIRRSAGNEHPHIVFSSFPCKSFSGLLAQSLTTSPKYEALNSLPLRGFWLTLEAFSDDPPELIIFENVPRIATRGRKLIDQITQLLTAYGYAVAETFHDCGEIGGLAQSRKRFLMVARHIAKVPPFLYEPPKRALRGVGEILGRMPMPGDPIAGPMHRVPSLHWSTWVRLAFVEAGKDWRSLKRLNVKDGYLTDYLLLPDTRSFKGSGYLGVNHWKDSSGTVAGCSRVGNGPFAVADPRMPESNPNRHDSLYRVEDWERHSHTVTGAAHSAGGGLAIADPRPDNQRQFSNSYQVVQWDHSAGTVIGRCQPSDGAQAVADPRGPHRRSCAIGVVEWSTHTGTVAGESLPSNGTFAVADPRHAGDPKFNNCFRTVEWSETSPAVTGGGGPSAGGLAVADPRPEWSGRHSNNLSCVDWQDSSPTVIAGGKGVQGGWLSVADPRPNLNREKGDDYLTAGHYGVVPWTAPTGSVSASGQHDNGPWSVADPRLPAATEKLVAVIRSMDNTWHRPFTTLELAALQSLVDPEEFLQLDGVSDSAYRQRIGNAVPAAAAQAIADEMCRTLLLAWSGETFQLSATPIWVRPVVVALAVKPATGEVQL